MRGLAIDDARHFRHRGSYLTRAADEKLRCGRPRVVFDDDDTDLQSRWWQTRRQFLYGMVTICKS